MPPALAARWSAAAPQTRGLVWFLFDQLLWLMTMVVVKALGDHYSVFQVVFMRLLIGCLLLSPKMVQMGVTRLKTKRPGEHLLRNLCAIVGMICSYLSLVWLPLAEATIISFTGPMIMTVIAVLMLGEVVRWRRWSAVIVGFSGVLFIAQPSAGVPLDAVALALFGTVVNCFGVATAKNLLRHEPAIQVSILFTIISLVMSIPLGLYFWRWPEPGDWPLFLVIGALATGGNYAFLRAYAEADAGFLAGFSYLRLIMAIALGYLFFAEVPGPWTLVGAAVILTSAVYIGWREAYLAKRGRDV